jgi:predicted PurR-regulated permease PerM
LGIDLSQQPPPPPEAKKSSRLIAVAIVMLLIGVAVGVAVGWSLGQSRSQAVQSEYTRVKVLSDGLQRVNMSGEDLLFTYNWMGQSAWNGSANIQNPIEVQVVGSNIDRILPPIQGRTYSIAGFEIVVSEVYDDYVILLVKSL